MLKTGCVRKLCKIYYQYLNLSGIVSMRKQLEPVHWISSRGIWKDWDKHQR